MAATINRSALKEAIVQADLRTSVLEVHTATDGRTFSIAYLAEAAEDLNANLAARATQINTLLEAQELDANARLLESKLRAQALLALTDQQIQDILIISAAELGRAKAILAEEAVKI